MQSDPAGAGAEKAALSLQEIASLVAAATQGESSGDAGERARSVKLIGEALSGLSAYVARREGVESSAFQSIERLVAVMSRQALTEAGFPRVRPADCQRITKAFAEAITANEHLFKTGDPEIGERFETAVEAYGRTQIRAYPAEHQRVIVLHARTRMLRGDPEGARKIVAPYADRSYLIQADFKTTLELLKTDLQARAALGQIDACVDRALWCAAMLVERDWRHARLVADEFAAFIAMRDTADLDAPFIARLGRWLAERALEARRVRGRPRTVKKARRREARRVRWLGRLLLALRIARRADLMFPKKGARIPSGILVTRAAQTIGDLLQMTPGLRALAKKTGEKIKLAIPQNLHVVFAHNPHVELVDVNGPAIDVCSFAKWRNFTICPAEDYESRRRPRVRRSRVEIFARALGLSSAELEATGGEPEAKAAGNLTTFAQTFLREADLGSRPLIGIQPFSRDTYRNHPEIGSIIQELAKTYHVILFHTHAGGLPAGKGIVTTAGLSLEKSLALVPALRAMVAVDSAFVQAAGAFGVPVVGLYGPTDGKLATAFHKRAEIVAKASEFPCMPCWRSDDIPCFVTGAPGHSPCMAAITSADVQGALERTLSGQPASSLKV
jgi:ADP-heptose:LPS heptosyltransferase